MESLLLKKEYKTKKTLAKVHVSSKRRKNKFSDLIEELDANLVVVKQPSLKDDWSAFTNFLGKEMLAKISI